MTEIIGDHEHALVTQPPQALHALFALRAPADLATVKKLLSDAATQLNAVRASCTALGGESYDPHLGIHEDVAAHLALPVPPRPIKVVALSTQHRAAFSTALLCHPSLRSHLGLDLYTFVHLCTQHVCTFLVTTALHGSSSACLLDQPGR